MKIFATLLVAAASALAWPAAAQDLPGRVGRLAHTEGTVSLYQDPDEGWERAYVNAPLTSENSLWTEPGSRAEMRVGGTAVRLDESTQLDIARLDDDEFDAIVSRGTVAVRVRHFEKNRRLVFNTPQARFSLRANGRYRIDVDPDRDESRLTVFVGEARVGSESGRLRVSAGRSVIVFGGANPEYFEERATTDRFDRWTVTRDERWTESRAIKYVSADMTGYEDLDRYGEWVQEPEFGALWFPTRVESDWAPYRHGRWDYVRPWGWTWIAEEPWGYAPYHYGRWVQVRNRWAWYPGQRTERATWAPALVAWFGGSNLSVGVSSGGPAVGWYPLAPWDRYEPWYNTNTTYVNRVNIIVRDSPPRQWQSQQQVRGDDWRYWNRERGATVVNREVLIERRPVRQSQIAVRPETMRQVQVQAPTQVLPTRNEVQQRRQVVRTEQARTQKAPVAAPTIPARLQPAQPGQPAQAAQPGAQPGAQNLRRVERPDFAKKAPATAEAPKQASAPPPARLTPPGKAAAPADNAKALEERQRADREAYEKQARDNQERSKQRDVFTRPVTPATPATPAAPARDGRPATPAIPATPATPSPAAQEQAQARERAARELQERGQQQRQVQEKAQQDKAKADAQQDKAKADAQQDKAKADAQQQLQQRAQQQQQQQLQQQQQEKAQQERAKADAQQMQQRAEQQKQGQERARAQQEKAKSDAAQQDKAKSDAAQQEKAKSDAAQQLQQRAEQQKQQALERAQKAPPQQQPQQQQQGQQVFPERAAAQKAAQEKKAREDKEKKDKEDEEKGKGRRF